MIAEAALATLGLAAFGVYYPNAWLFGPVVGKGPTDRRQLFLTFDDGPNPFATDAILDVLSREAVPATFFMVGDHVRRYPDVACRVRAAGHEVGNHTNSHVKLHLRGPARIRAEISEAHRIITECTGTAPRTFRAPHGYRNPFVGLTTREFGYRTFGWTCGVWDSARPGAEVIRQRTRRRLQAGAIILLHDGDGYDPRGDRMQTVEALPGIIRDARDLGYTFQSLAGLIH